MNTLDFLKMRTKLWLSCLLCFLGISVSEAQNTAATIDSLFQVLNTLQTDSARARVLTRLSYLYWYTSVDTSIMYSQQAYELVDGKKEKAYELLKANALNSMGVALSYRKEDVLALKKLIESIEIYARYDMQLNVAYGRGNIALIRSAQNDCESAVKEFLLMREIFEKEKDGMEKEMNLVVTASNLCGCYLKLKAFDKALESILPSAQNDAFFDKPYLGVLKGQTGEALTTLRRFDEAKTYFDEGLKLVRSGNDNTHIASVYLGLAIWADSLGQAKQVIEYGETGYDYIEKAGENTIREGYLELLAKNYFAVGDFKNAYVFTDQLLELRDSIYTATREKELHQLQLQQKDAEIAIERKEKELQEESSQKKNYIIISVVGALCSAVILAMMFFRGRQKEKNSSNLLREQKNAILQQNEELQQQSEEIASQRDFIEENNKILHHRNEQITKSIQAAKLIQHAMLPYDSRVSTLLKEYFVIYQPKDIVSGDFYWVNQVNDTTIVAAVDCTGHGVPGAFMSMIGNLLLEEIIMINQHTSPSMILNRLNAQTIRALQQENTQDLNGMDIALVAIKPLENEQFSLHFSGAKRPLYYSLPEETTINSIKGTNKSIGGRQNEKQFEENELILPSGSMLYLGSDGFEDQHNTTNRKIGRTQLLKLLAQVKNEPLAVQKTYMQDFLQKHMKGVEQRDDILLMGIKL